MWIYEQVRNVRMWLLSYSVHIIFVATGIFSTVCVQEISYQGGAHGRSMIPPFIAYLGYLMSAWYFAWYDDKDGEGKNGPEKKKELNSLNGGANVDMVVVGGRKDEKVLIVDDDDKQQCVPDTLPVRVLSMNDQVNRKSKSSLHTATNSQVVSPSPARIPTPDTVNWPMILICVTDVLGQALQVSAIAYAGSGVFQVCYSSILVCTALLSLVFLNKSHTRLQWISMVWITGGLLLNAMSASPSSSSKTLPDDGAPVIGIALTLLTTFVFGCQYVLFERLLSQSVRPMSQTKICENIGKYGMALVTVYLVMYTFPNWNMLILDPIHDHGGSLSQVFMLYLFLLANVAGHIIAYVKILGKSGAVATGVMQALRAVGVFAISAVMFCDRQSSQCFTRVKAASSFNVIGGVLLFSYASELQNQSTKVRGAVE